MRSAFFHFRVPRLDVLEDRTMPATFTVTTLQDDVAGSLRQAVAAANANDGEDLIVFHGKLSGTVALTGGQLTITDDVVIRGTGADKVTVSGEGASRVFAVLPDGTDGPPTVTIQKLTIANGLATDALGFPSEFGFAFGGGLYNLGGTVHLDHVTMVNNQALGATIGAGGAVANEFGGTTTVSHSRFADNTAQGLFIAVGGAITSDLGPTAGGGLTQSPSLTIDHSYFSGNTARSLVGETQVPAFFPFSGFALGGAVTNLTGSLDVSHSTFEGNSAVGGAGTDAVDGTPRAAGGQAIGGAIFSDDLTLFGVADSTMTVRHSTFIGNVAQGGAGAADGGDGGRASGGALTVSIGGEASLEHNVFSGNMALGGAGGGDDGNGGVATGGGVAGLAGASLTLAHNSFLGNVARGGQGAAEGAGGDGRGGGFALSILDAPGFDGLVASASISHGSFVGNVAQGGDGGDGGDGLGGGLFNDEGATLELDKVLVRGNSAVGGEGGEGVGGGLYNLGIAELISSLLFANFASDSDPDCFGC